jgi:hypothetical protein
LICTLPGEEHSVVEPPKAPEPPVLTHCGRVGAGWALAAGAAKIAAAAPAAANSGVKYRSVVRIGAPFLKVIPG